MTWAYCKKCMTRVMVNKASGMCEKGHKAMDSAYQRARKEFKSKEANK